jgi:hypothetical protein
MLSVLTYDARLDPTTSDLQAQIDRLSLAVHRERDAQLQLEPTAQRLAQLTERCTAILNRWADADHRQAAALGDIQARLRDWGAAEARLQQDAADRLRGLEKTVEQEWAALRQLHEEPIKELRAQAATLGEICVSAANVAIHGFERTEARITALETTLQDRLGQLASEVRALIGDGRLEGVRASQLQEGVAPFPIEGVMRIHDELRDVDGPAPPLALVRTDSAHADAVRSEPAFESERPRMPDAAGLSDRMATLEQEVTTERKELHDTSSRTKRLRREWQIALVVLAIAIAAGGWWLRSVNARLTEAAAHVTAAEREATAASDAAGKEVAEARTLAAHEIAQARETAIRAELVSTVLAAPDLVRYSLVATDPASRAYAQMLWSRSRGLVVSASRLPAPPAGAVYQVWLLNTGAPIDVGMLTPDAAGGVTLAVPPPATLAGAVAGASVTLEPGGHHPAPAGAIVLARASQ